MAESPTAEFYDQWYSELQHAPVKDEITRRHLGLPPHLLSTSLLPWEGIADIVEALCLSLGDVLLDLACGRGGYGMEVANRAGAQLVGVDYSRVAVQLATQQAERLEREADFRVGDMAATGLPADSVHAVMCIDAIQFAPNQHAVYRELRRVLRRGGRVVLTTWQPADPNNGALPKPLAELDLQGGLASAGYTDIAVKERPDWLEQETAMWQQAAGLDPGEDPALRSLRDEAVEVLATDGEIRVIASATS